MFTKISLKLLLVLRKNGLGVWEKAIPDWKVQQFA
jgi:hypothetical protein